MDMPLMVVALQGVVAAAVALAASPFPAHPTCPSQLANMLASNCIAFFAGRMTGHGSCWVVALQGVACSVLALVWMHLLHLTFASAPHLVQKLWDCLLQVHCVLEELTLLQLDVLQMAILA